MKYILIGMVGAVVVVGGVLLSAEWRLRERATPQPSEELFSGERCDAPIAAFEANPSGASAGARFAVQRCLENMKK